MNSKSNGMNRRRFLESATLATASTFFLGGVTSSRLLAQDRVNTTISPTVSTTAGKIRGLVRFGVNQFYGVPYGASTAGPNRFMPPQKSTPWTGVKDAFEVGHRSPQDGGGPVSVVWAMDRREQDGEDCLNINIFSPGLGGGNRPVMVWMHGGGFSGGSGNWLVYDGTNLARKENVVVVSVTHRLNMFGFLHLAGLGGGEKWANSTNVGMQDIVAALAWIKDNIAAFGGNPGNVTIFGQSGGGGKVTTTMAMPSAKGLFHRAIAQSGSAFTGTTSATATQGTERLLAKLGLKANQLEELQKMPYTQLQQAAEGVMGVSNSPVIDGKILPRNQWSPTAPDDSATVPLMMGNVETENGWVGPPPAELSDADLLTAVARMFRNDQAKAAEIITLYKKTHKDHATDNQAIRLMIDTDNSRRANAQSLGELKFAQGKAASYLYHFNWYSPVYDNRMKSYHTLDIPFAFYNVDIASSMTGSQQRRYALAEKMSATWAAFAKNGNPNNPSIPNWPAFNPTQYPTMILGDEVKLAMDPNKEERLALKALRGTQPTQQQDEE